jgi:NAD(P)-dependent dehydrogenase (short-subunit alcohol dehydrogenase family)
LRVFVLGGTGSIGSALVRKLVARGHGVLGMARSEASAAKLGKLGATAVAGTIALPAPWIGKLVGPDPVLHAACDFSTDMGAIERRLLDVLLPALGLRPNKPASSTPAAAGCSAQPEMRLRPSRRLSIPCPPSHGWC